MAIEHYRATTVRNLKDFAQYAVYPIAKLGALAVFKDERKANIAAGLATTGFYGGLNSFFFGVEASAFDRNFRTGVAAELGMRPQDLKFADYYKSDNEMVKRRLALFDTEAKYWYPISFLPMLPAAMDVASMKFPGLKRYEANSARTKLPPNASALQHMGNGWGLWDGLTYASVALAWSGETYGINKGGTYEGEKTRENKIEVSRRVDANDLIGIVNRCRTDQNLAMITDKTEVDALWPLLEKLAEKMNHSPNYHGVAEAMYLVGNHALDIFQKNEKGFEIRDDAGKRTVSEAALSGAYAQIERLDRIGLAGVGEENRKSFGQDATTQLGAARPGSEFARKNSHKPGVIGRMNHKLLEAEFNTYQSLFGQKGTGREYVSSRDPGEVPARMA